MNINEVIRNKVELGISYKFQAKTLGISEQALYARVKRHKVVK